MREGISLSGLLVKTNIDPSSYSRSKAHTVNVQDELTESLFLSISKRGKVYLLGEILKVSHAIWLLVPLETVERKLGHK